MVEGGSAGIETTVPGQPPLEQMMQDFQSGVLKTTDQLQAFLHRVQTLERQVRQQIETKTAANSPPTTAEATHGHPIINQMVEPLRQPLNSMAERVRDALIPASTPTHEVSTPATVSAPEDTTPLSSRAEFSHPYGRLFRQQILDQFADPQRTELPTIAAVRQELVTTAENLKLNLTDQERQHIMEDVGRELSTLQPAFHAASKIEARLYPDVCNGTIQNGNAEQGIDQALARYEEKHGPLPNTHRQLVVQRLRNRMKGAIAEWAPATTATATLRQRLQKEITAGITTADGVRERILAAVARYEVEENQNLQPDSPQERMALHRLEQTLIPLAQEWAPVFTAADTITADIITQMRQGTDSIGTPQQVETVVAHYLRTHPGETFTPEQQTVLTDRVQAAATEESERASRQYRAGHEIANHLWNNDALQTITQTDVQAAINDYVAQHPEMHALPPADVEEQVHKMLTVHKLTAGAQVNRYQTYIPETPHKNQDAQKKPSLLRRLAHRIGL